MVDVSAITTAGKLLKHYEDKGRDVYLQPTLGASQLGDPCERALYYGFRWYDTKQWEPRMVRRLEHGNMEEKRTIADLRAIGLTIEREQEKHYALGGHVTCKVDGVITGLPEAPHKPHVLEVKLTNEKGYKALKKEGVQDAKYGHYAQTMIGMGLTGIDRGLYFSTNSNDDDWYAERVHYKASVFDALIMKAERVIFAPYLPPRIEEKPDKHPCKTCAFNEVCWEGKEPLFNCRTCEWSQPKRDGTWWCGKREKALDREEQKQGCELFERGANNVYTMQDSSEGE